MRLTPDDTWGGEPSDSVSSGSLGDGLGHNAHVLALLGTLLLKEYLAIDLGEERVVRSHPDVRARMHLSAALAHDDVAGEHLLTAETLHAQSFGVGLAAVLGTAA